MGRLIGHGVHWQTMRAVSEEVKLDEPVEFSLVV
jgi:hypothetical protein